MLHGTLGQILPLCLLKPRGMVIPAHNLAQKRHSKELKSRIIGIYFLGSSSHLLLSCFLVWVQVTTKHRTILCDLEG